jgi:hypothetical protein
VGKSSFKRYSRLCLEALREKLKKVDLNALWLEKKVQKAVAVPA